MYLKNVEIVGFKSFANRTRLEFQPGMTAIVGPNGCGKSNISDAIRWVLGEQSAKALRGTNMQDVIFNGTDDQKPLGMAEVSLTLAECEAALGTEYHEVTVTRRVFRTGEGQYFMNRTPCRLKDIQRLFMDTGIGTNAYSLMEQGRIDRILSSRPEDRREVFEEASGITKYKADKREAIRKLEHTEANLLRLADIIREVKRQIISLQRQAGKARRFKTLQEQLRGIDIFVTREKLAQIDQDIELAQTRLASVNEQSEALRLDIQQREQGAEETRRSLARIEEEIAAAMDAAVEAKTELDRSQQLISVNTDRIAELQSLSERDSRDADAARQSLAENRKALEALTGELAKTEGEKAQADADLARRAARLAELEEQVESARRTIESMRNESIDLESRHAKLQNELSDLETAERSSVVRRERLHAEHSGLQRSVELYAQRQEQRAAKLGELRQECERQERLLAELTGERSKNSSEVAAIERTINSLATKLASKKAQIDVLHGEFNEEDPYPGGARVLLSAPENIPVPRKKIIGALAEHLEAEPKYRTALEAVLRAWLDAVVIEDDAAVKDILRSLAQDKQGPVRLLAAKTAVELMPLSSDGDGEYLLDHVKCPERMHPVLQRLLHGVHVVQHLGQIPYPVLPGVTYVTLDGAVVRGDGSAEYWMQESRASNPLTRKHLLAEWEQDCAETRKELDLRTQTLERLRLQESSAGQAIKDAEDRLNESRHSLAVCEGENQVIAEEARQARERAETVEWELKSITDQEGSGESRRTAIHRQLEEIRDRQSDIRAQTHTRGDELRDLENLRSEAMSEVTECRVRAAECRQRVEHHLARREPLEAQVHSLESVIRERADGMTSYQARIEELQGHIQTARGRIQPLEDEVRTRNAELETRRGEREQRTAALAEMDRDLREKRAVFDDVRTRKSEYDVELAEQKMRRQNIIDRVSADYRITADRIADEPEPQWEDGRRPDREAMETAVAEIRAKIEAMGPVNLVAIEEHQELEERYAFLTQQQDDLVKAKQQLMDMIRRINSTTTELFSQTFNAVNENFQEMFKKLFGGGSAKLVLVDETDVLESGIEIIARPPGKKLQSVSLLSGGERTITAVALLFSLYMVKPSPFCVLDELDAALDDSNIGRFVRTVKDFLLKSQFIVITHNRQTISASDVLYGVTMEKRGISKIVSVRFSDVEKSGDEVRIRKGQESQPAVEVSAAQSAEGPVSP